MAYNKVMIQSIRLQHFRSYTDASFDLHPEVTIVAGPNASGKTNLLEALLMVAHGSSYRARDSELIQFGADWARLDAATPGHRRVVKLRKTHATEKSYEIDDQSLTRLHQSKTLPVVLFEPNHLLLWSGSPDLRRSFMDDLIEQTEPGFGAVRRHYRRVLAQRNALLKRNPAGLEQQLFVWNIRLSELGGQIARLRQTLVNRFNEQAGELYGRLAGRPHAIHLRYATRFDATHYESQLLHKLESNLSAEVQRGFTAYGPHRDDLAVYIDDRTVQESASRGETRTLVLALKILELRLLEQSRECKPLLLLDDVFSELDTTRRQALTTYIRDYQTCITTTDADVVGDSLKGAGSVIMLGGPAAGA